MKRYRSEIQLINPTKKKWDLFKSIDGEIVNLVKKHGVTLIKTVYEDELFIKTIIFDDINEGENINVVFEVGNFLGSHNLKMNIIKMIEIIPTVKKIKYVIKLIDSTPEKWKKFLDSESYIKNISEEENIVRDYITYNHNDSTLSVQVEYHNEKCRENLNNKITTYLNKIGLHQEIIKATEFRDYSDEIIELPLYNANKLIDLAEESLDKLSHM